MLLNVNKTKTCLAGQLAGYQFKVKKKTLKTMTDEMPYLMSKKMSKNCGKKLALEKALNETHRDLVDVNQHNSGKPRLKQPLLNRCPRCLKF